MAIIFSVVWLCVAVLTMLSDDTAKMSGSIDEASSSVSVLEANQFKVKLLQGLETSLYKISTKLAGTIPEKNQKSMYYLQKGLCLDSLF